MSARRGRPPHPEPVTPAEARVLQLVREGLPNAEIAIRLGLSVNTVRYHVSNLLSKAGVAERNELKRWAATSGSGRSRWEWWPLIVGGGLAAAIAITVIASAVNHWTPDGEAAPQFPKYTVSVFAGSGKFASEDGKGTEASFRDPRGIAVDAETGNVLVTEVWNACVRLITPDGVVTTLATYVNPDVSNGVTCEISGLDGSPLVLSHGSHLYGLHGIGRLLRFDLGFSADPTTLLRVADIPTTSAQGPAVFAAALAGDGSLLLLDSPGSRIWRLHDGSLTPVAGTGAIGLADGPAAQATFFEPEGMALAPDAGLYVADTRNHLIRYVSASGAVSTVAGSGASGAADGPAHEASFVAPSSLARDSDGNLWILDRIAGSVRVLSDGHVFTVATGLDFSGGYPAVAAAPDGTIYVSEGGANRILKLTEAP